MLSIELTCTRVSSCLGLHTYLEATIEITLPPKQQIARCLKAVKWLNALEGLGALNTPLAIAPYRCSTCILVQEVSNRLQCAAFPDGFHNGGVHIKNVQSNVGCFLASPLCMLFPRFDTSLNWLCCTNRFTVVFWNCLMHMLVMRLGGRSQMPLATCRCMMPDKSVQHAYAMVKSTPLQEAGRNPRLNMKVFCFPFLYFFCFGSKTACLALGCLKSPAGEHGLCQGRYILGGMHGFVEWKRSLEQAKHHSGDRSFRMNLKAMVSFSLIG